MEELNYDFKCVLYFEQNVIYDWGIISWKIKCKSTSIMGWIKLWDVGLACGRYNMNCYSFYLYKQEK